ncbi:MAG TPA: serine hydrolase [Gemmatimonadaceae bacterium]|nr:serine hydrolase [Gemmatimonadaceae bacterium]
MIDLVFLAILTGVGTLSSPPAQRSTDSLRAAITARVAQTKGATVAVAFRRLGTTDTLMIAADSDFHAASTMKVPVMIELFQQVDSGRLSLDRKLTLVNQFTSIADGSPYSLDMADDSDSSLYARVGTQVPIRELMDLMITRSSNLATNVLIDVAGAPRAQQAMRALGASRIRVLRGVEDGKAYKLGMNNTTTARDLTIIMSAIAENRAASPASCAAMREILFRQEFKDEIPAGLPPNTRVAHKTGWIDGRVLHDAAIIYPAGGPVYVLTVLTSGVADLKANSALIADISRLVYGHVLSASLAGRAS